MERSITVSTNVVSKEIVILKQVSFVSVETMTIVPIHERKASVFFFFLVTKAINISMQYYLVLDHKDKVHFNGGSNVMSLMNLVRRRQKRGTLSVVCFYSPSLLSESNSLLWFQPYTMFG